VYVGNFIFKDRCESQYVKIFVLNTSAPIQLESTYMLCQF